MANVAVEQYARKTRRWFRPTLIWLVGFVFVAALWLGWIANAARTQRLAVEEIRRPDFWPGERVPHSGGFVRYDYQVAEATAAGQDPFSFKPSPIKASSIGGFLRRELGVDYFDRVTAISMYNTANKAKIKALGRLSDLRRLELRGGQNLGDEDMAIFERMMYLERLTIWKAKLSDAGMSHFADLRQLERLDLTFSTIQETGLRHLRELPNLKTLILGQCPISDSGWRDLEHLTQVQTLFLSGAKLSNDNLSCLTGMTALQKLYLPSATIGDPALVHLRKMPSLKMVDLRGTLVTQGGIDRLKNDMPHLQIRFP